MKRERDIFRQASTTYYFSTLFFPEPIRSDVFRLYSFVRVADDYVDNVPAQPQKLRALERAWRKAWADPTFETTPVSTDSLDARVVKNLVYVARKYDFDPLWLRDFFKAMKADIRPCAYKNLDDTLEYVHGSAEVIGLMMACILRLPQDAWHAAVMQGRAMQFINFIRDIAEDVMLGRCYFPSEELRHFGLKDLREDTARTHPEAFVAFMRYQLDRYGEWQTEAARGFAYIPRRYRIPVRVAADMYDWTAAQIAANPFVVFAYKIKPTRRRVMNRALLRSLRG